ncbi:PrgI family protein [Dactylosporangium sp. NPDC049140]|uniref:PrgI family protein n=1 Tax=Dactylosporangium sp. NPDC049140 TaxID=3155647 RepID=UPI0034089D17
MDAEEVHARVPADIEAPDRIVWGLTARQVAIIGAAAALGYLILRTIGHVLPLPVVAIMLIPLAGVAVALALGRRDGLPLDAWLWAAIVNRRTPRRAVPATAGVVPVPAWAPQVEADGPPPAVLRLPARGIADNGVIDLGDGTATALVAATTVNVGLRTAAEQAALVGSYARWLNSLTGPVQVVVSAQRVDLTSHAIRVADAAETLPHPALADAALDYSDFLLDVAARRDPLWRTVTVAHTATGERGAATEAIRRAEHTAAALATLGAQTRVLDGGTATAVLTAAVDPYQDTDASWPRTPAHAPITAPGLDEELGA